MTNVIPLRCVQPGAASPAHAANTPTTPSDGRAWPALARQQAIENALSMALHWVRRQDAGPRALHAATVRANRAAAMLKQACADHQSQEGGAA